MSNYSIADKSTSTQLHTERSKVLKAVDNDLGSLEFMLSPDRDGNGALLVLWEKRGTLTWGIPVCDFTNQNDAEEAAATFNNLVKDNVLRAGPLLPTNDPVKPGMQKNDLRAVLEGNDPSWNVDLFFKSPEEAIGLTNAFNCLLASRVVRFVPEEAPRRLKDEISLAMGMSRLSDKDQGVTSILTDVCNASSKVDPENHNSPWAPLEALDRAGIYGNDIEGLYQLCGRHPGRMVAVLRAVPLGLIDPPAIQAALKPVGIVRAGGLDVDCIVTAVESAIPGFSASRVQPDTLTGPKAPDLHAAPDRFVRETQTPPKNLGRGGSRQGGDGK